MSSALFLLCFSMFAVVQDLISFIRGCIEQCNLHILSRRSDICKYRSSANEWYRIECESMIVVKCLMYK